MSRSRGRAGVRDILLGDGVIEISQLTGSDSTWRSGSSSVLAARSSCYYTDLVSSGGHGATNYRAGCGRL